ncbi:MAG: hypothetical protein GC181_12915 [Bacteroidetes bacterium]|nr:hypothetical protein [Bacteroidota bacterium]
MLTRLTIFTIGFVLIGACSNPKTQTETSNNIPRESEIKVNWDNIEFFPVYEFAPDIMGLTIELDFDHESDYVKIYRSVDSTENLGTYLLFDPDSAARLSPEIIRIDTNHRMLFYKNETFDKALLKLISGEFYIYCTKGVIKRNLKDVVYSISECASNVIVFRFDSIDVKRWGHPILCSRAKIGFEFASFPELDREMFALKHKEEPAYTDNLENKSFAKLDSVYLIYADNFKWMNERGGYAETFFPGRGIAVTSPGKKLRFRKFYGLDLFGIPCD